MPIADYKTHCKLLDSFLIPLVAEKERRRKAGLPTLFNSHLASVHPESGHKYCGKGLQP